MVSPLIFERDVLYILDQRKLPFKEEYFLARSGSEVVHAIKEMILRGAPLIAFAGAYALLLDMRAGKDVLQTMEALKRTRPTAVNLFNMLSEMRRLLEDGASYEDMLNFVRKKEHEEKLIYERIGEHGSKLIPKNARVMTYCNTGFLATLGIGTAMGVIYKAFLQGKIEEVIVPETRPYLQGARLTVYELRKLGIPHKLITDNSASFLMSRGMVDCVVVGADRVVMNGDLANKIGTLQLALSSYYFRIPFYTALPTSTIDTERDTFGDVTIEQRSSREITSLGTCRITFEDTQTYNFAFDITPSRFISAYITEHGVFEDIKLALGT